MGNNLPSKLKNTAPYNIFSALEIFHARLSVSTPVVLIKQAGYDLLWLWI